MHRVLIAFAVGYGAVAAPLASQDSIVAFTGVTVIPMVRERAIDDQTVVVQGGRIAALGPTASTPVPAGATRVDGRGKYLIPGLAEMHAHIPTPPVEAQFGAGFGESVLKLYVANGVTTIRGMLGHPSHLALRERVRGGALLGPTIYASGPSLNGNSEPDPATARRTVLQQQAAGYDFLKIHPGLSRETFDTLARVADSVGIRFAGHVPVAVGLDRALEAHYASIDHVDGFIEYLTGWQPGDGTPAGFFGFNISDRADESKLPGIARRTQEAGVWIVPTQALMDGFVSAEDAAVMGRRPEMRYLPKPLVAQWVQAKHNAQAQPTYDAGRARRFIALRGRIIRALHAAGVGIVLGSDAPQVMNVPGFSVHRELAVLVAAGLTPYQALETGTRNVAAYFGTLDQSGTVAAGKVADLVLLDANPLTDIANTTRIAGVMARGKWLSRAALDSMLNAIAAAYAP